MPALRRAAGREWHCKGWARCCAERRPRGAPASGAPGLRSDARAPAWSGGMSAGSASGRSPGGLHPGPPRLCAPARLLQGSHGSRGRLGAARLHEPRPPQCLQVQRLVLVALEREGMVQSQRHAGARRVCGTVRVGPLQASVSCFGVGEDARGHAAVRRALQGVTDHAPVDAAGGMCIALEWRAAPCCSPPMLPNKLPTACTGANTSSPRHLQPARQAGRPRQHSWRRGAPGSGRRLHCTGASWSPAVAAGPAQVQQPRGC